MLYFPHLDGGLMKNIILICGLLVSGFSFGAVNSESNNVDSWNEQREFCESFTEVAESMMKARQRGVSLKDMYTTLAVLDAESRDVYEGILKAVYTVEMMDTDYDSEVVVLEFSNGFFETCMGLK